MHAFTGPRATRWMILMIIGHIVALVFGLAGLLIAVPNPHLWADSEMGVRVYSWGMTYAGGSHIIFATFAMLIVGIRFLGLRRTAWFFGIACVVSLSAELIGTTTGFPFGAYSYTSGLGYKLFGEVPFTIPLSWFYMGLASYMLALVLAGSGPGWKRPLTAVLTGAILLTIWDLVLDPAMAHQQLDVRFWQWEQGGLYFDMPVQNFFGWMLTGFMFIGLSRLFWGSEPMLTSGLIRVSYVIYLANLIFAMVISAGVGLWWPVLITIVVGVIPATLALLVAEGWPDGTGLPGAFRHDDTARRVSRGVMTIGARFCLAREATRVNVDGMEHIPERGPALLVARHFHHLLDGCAMQVNLPRQMHIIVATDWATPGLQQRLLETACRMARWPMVIRPDSDKAERFREAERVRTLREAFRQSVELLGEGRLLVVFPEGYPTIDPHGSRKESDDQFLSFDPGFVSIVRAAERRTSLQIPVIPIGLDYIQDESGRWDIQMRAGAPIFLSNFSSSTAVVESLSHRVRALSAPATLTVPGDSSTLTETS